MAKKTQDLGRVTRPFSIGYAYAQTQHYRDAVAAQAAEAPATPTVEADPFDAIETPGPAPVRISAGPTEPMVAYVLSLTKRNLGEVTPEVLAAAEAHVRSLSKYEAGKLIDTLKAIPAAPRKATPAPAPAAKVEEGMYRDPATGDIFKVQVAHHGSGNLYAKRLVKLDEVAVKRGKEYSHDFVYAPGAIRLIQASWRMTKDEAIEWGQLYGACCRCGTILTDEKSIEAGIGPVCSGKI